VLSQFLVSELFGFLLVFCRLGSAMMLLPGFGELYVAVRARLFMAFMFSLVLSPVLHLPPPPDSVVGLVTLLLAEIAVGVFIGGLSRMIISAVNIAGMIIAYEPSLASALTVDMTQNQGAQDTSLGNFLSVTAVVLMFSMNLHHMMLRGLADSYTLFLPGQFPLVADFANHAAHTMSGIFLMGVQMASPHIVIGLILYLGAGIISRLIPNIQIFFVLMAPQLLLSFFVLMVAFSAIMMWYMDYFKNTLATFLAPQ
jgi:flagellar biosynthetic protein FliR